MRIVKWREIVSPLRRMEAMRILAACVLVTLSIAARADTAADPYTGTWILNLAQSGGEQRSQVLTITVTGDQETYRSELTLKNGTKQVTNYTAAYDGKEYPSQ